MSIREVKKEEIFNFDIFMVDVLLDALEDNFNSTLTYSNFRKYDFIYVRICEDDISKFIVSYGIKDDHGNFNYDTFIMSRA